MMAHRISASMLAGLLGLALGAPCTALATVDAQAAGTGSAAATATVPASRTTTVPPSYDSHDQPGPATGNYNTPEADGRPGEYYFQLGVNAFYKKDYEHAVAMFKVAASWAYKPAEFNLALMYFKGEGVRQDRSLGAAWMVLAAERPGSKYARTRDVMVSALSNAEFARTNTLWKDLKPTYGDDVALHRAKARWAQVKSHMTGSRVGDGAVHLLVGGNGDAVSPGLPSKVAGVKSSVGGPEVTSGAQLFRSGQPTDGSIAYQQFQQSDNPYDRTFRTDLTGTSSVGPLTPAGKTDEKPQKQSDSSGHDR
jgi:hypothetical protein